MGFINKQLVAVKRRVSKVSKTKFRRSLCLIIVLLAMGVSGCDTAPPSQYRYTPPKQIQDGLIAGSMEDMGMDVALVEEMVDRVLAGQVPEFHSVLIIKDGKLVMERYFQGHDFQYDAPGYHGDWTAHNRYSTHTTMSVGKSFVSANIGIAVSLGYIDSVHDSIFKYLPDHQHLNTDGKDEITVEHLLTMSSGLDWQEWGTSNTSPNSDLFNLWIESAGDQVASVVGKPLIKEPGTHFTYNSGGTIVLTEILKNATGMDIEDFSAQYLFEPLSSNAPKWKRFESGVADGSGGFYITPRDMAKLGILYLNNGMWNGEQIFSPEWVTLSATPYGNNSGINVPHEDVKRTGYAYTWWTKEVSGSAGKYDMFYAEGWGGQKIYVIPDLDAVVVFTGGIYTSKNSNYELLTEYIIPTIE